MYEAVYEEKDDRGIARMLLTNKIHTPMMENDETLGKWYGNFYTTASLGFVPQIIKMGMKAYKALLSLIEEYYSPVVPVN